MGISNFVLIPTVSFFSIFFPLSKMKCPFLVCCFAIAVFAAPGLRPGTKIIHHPQLGPLPFFSDRRRTSQRRFIQTVPQQQQLGPLPFFPDRRRTSQRRFIQTVPQQQEQRQQQLQRLQRQEQLLLARQNPQGRFAHSQSFEGPRWPRL